MAKITTSDFGAIHDALNKMIIGEVKEALKLVPGKRIEWNRKTPLCHIILSCNDVYIPREVEVLGASIGSETMPEYDGLVIHGRNADDNTSVGILWYEDETDWLDITDFHYLIEQIAGQVEGDNTYRLETMSLLTCGYSPYLSLKAAMDKEVTV